MLSVFVVVPLTLFLLMMAIPAFCFSSAMLVMLAWSLPESIIQGGFWGFVGWCSQVVWMGPLMAMVAWGSFSLGSVVIDGFIGRFFG